MKKLITQVTLLIFGISFAQEFNGVAYYSSKTNLGDIKISNNENSPEMNDKFKEAMRKAFEKEFVLHFNKTESLYEEEVKLETQQGDSGFKVETFSSGGNNDKLYKNLKDKQIIKEDDIFGKEFLIVDQLENHKWELLNETKKIGNYTCMKAQIVIPVTEEDIKEYEDEIAKQKTGKTQFFTPSEPKERVIEAWYTMEIPIATGPRNFWGLPGLILELHEGNTSLLCTKVVINPKEKIAIKKPKKGKKVSQKEFNKIMEDKLESMTNSDGTIEIRMN